MTKSNAEKQTEAHATRLEREGDIQAAAELRRLVHNNRVLTDALRHIENASTDLRVQRYEIRAAATEALAAYAAAQSAPSERAQQSELASILARLEAVQRSSFGDQIALGWNQCRAAMLAAARGDTK